MIFKLSCCNTKTIRGNIRKSVGNGENDMGEIIKIRGVEFDTGDELDMISVWGCYHE